MVVNRQRYDPVRLLGRRVLLLFLFVLVVFVGMGVWNIYWKEQESIALKTQAQLQLADLAQRQGQLQARIADLETERGKEEALREQYAMGKNGEQLIIITSTEKPPASVATTTPLQRWVHRTFPWW